MSKKGRTSDGSTPYPLFKTIRQENDQVSTLNEDSNGNTATTNQSSKLIQLFQLLNSLAGEVENNKSTIIEILDDEIAAVKTSHKKVLLYENLEMNLILSFQKLITVQLNVVIVPAYESAGHVKAKSVSIIKLPYANATLKLTGIVSCHSYRSIENYSLAFAQLSNINIGVNRKNCKTIISTLHNFCYKILMKQLQYEYFTIMIDGTDLQCSNVVNVMLYNNKESFFLTSLELEDKTAKNTADVLMTFIENNFNSKYMIALVMDSAPTSFGSISSRGGKNNILYHVQQKWS
uniref:DUF659 domain-containing protein n=1 Tax=Rhabditophanes sp. KR3021 TaxID=114890 RepID=A0AC35TXH4_9BILA